MDSGSVPQITSARRPPECWSAAMRALSWPVVARNTVTLTPGSSLENPFTTAVTVFCVTDVYRVSCCGVWLAAVDAWEEAEGPWVEAEDPQAATPARRTGSTAPAAGGNLMMTSVMVGRCPARQVRGSSRAGAGQPGL